jgi:hypothetical protein
MNMQDSFSQLNWLAIFTAALSAFLIGGFWYSLFAKQWMATNNFTKEFLKERKMPFVFGLSFIFSFIMAFNLALFIGKEGIAFGGTAGFMTGFGWIFFAIAIIALFEKRSLTYMLINGGYMIAAFTSMGFILGAWH